MTTNKTTMECDWREEIKGTYSKYSSKTIYGHKRQHNCKVHFDFSNLHFALFLGVRRGWLFEKQTIHVLG